MGTFKFKGVDKLIGQFNKLADNSEAMIGKAIYNGAAVTMAEVTRGIDKIKTDDRYVPEGEMKTGPSTYQKIGLQRSVGISKMRKDGDFYNVKIGFDGYNGMKTKAWPQGQPNSMIARSVESGTSFMQKQAFMRNSERRAKKKCEAAMAETIDKEIQRIVQSSN